MGRDRQKIDGGGVRGDAAEEKVCVLIVGPCGTGKSHIAQALGHCAIRVGHDVLFTTVSRMLGQLNAARATNGFDRSFAKLAAVDLLIDKAKLIAR